MSGSRERVLAAVREALGPPRDPATIAAEANALLGSPELLRSTLPNRSLADLFCDRVSAPKVGATVERVRSLRDFPGAARRYLDAGRLPAAVALQPVADLRELDWSGLTLHATMASDECAGVGMARWGIAESGSLVFHSGPDTPVLFNFLPRHSIIALRARDIVAYLEDYAALAARSGPPPRNINLITGASGTTDIEGSYVRGAHGPGFLHVVVVED